MFLEVSKYLVCRVLKGASILDSKGIPSWLCSHYKRNQNGWRLFRALFFHERGTNHLPPHHAPKIRPFPGVSLPRGCKNAFLVCACPAMIPGASTLRCRAKGFFYTENMWAAEPGRPLILKKCHIVVWVNIDLPLSSCKEIARNAIITDGHLSLIAKVQNCFVFRAKWLGAISGYVQVHLRIQHLCNLYTENTLR